MAAALALTPTGSPAADPLPRLTPLPTAVAGVAHPVMALDGRWEFTPGDGGRWSPIEVPGEWAMQGFEVGKGGWAVYRRSFEIPSDWAGGPARLRFEAVHAVCEVSVNGRPVGGHVGGFVPFELEVGEALAPGGRNEVVVRVQCESVADTISCISQYAAHQVGGIVRPVRLVRLPAVHLAGQAMDTRLDRGAAVLTVRSEIAGADPRSERPLVSHRLLDPSGRPVAECAGSEPGQELRVQQPCLWTSEAPSLYTLQTRISVGGREVETVSRAVGLRTVEVAGDRLLVNGRPVKLAGLNRHEVHPLRGRSLTPELCRRDAELFRAANVNLVRTSHYPPSEAFLDACDELGIFVECEAAVCWIGHHASPAWSEGWDKEDPRYLPYFRRAALEMIAAFRRHPCVIMWSPANESAWTDSFATVVREMKAMDPTRPVVFHDQHWGDFNNLGSRGDIANHHYPSEEDPRLWSEAGRPVWFGEYAHLQCYNRRELVTDPWIRVDWGRPLARMVDLMWSQPGCLGGAIWSGIDDVFHLPNGDLRGYGHWGPVDGWRRRKPEWAGMRGAYSPFKVLEAVPPDPGAAKPVVRLKVQNRFNFTDLSQCEIRWRIGRVRSLPGGEVDRPDPAEGVIPVSLAPHRIGEVLLDGELFGGWGMSLRVTDPRGVVVAEHDVAELLRRQPPRSIPSKVASGAARAAKRRRVGVDDDRLVLDSGDGRRLVIPPPLPMVLPLNEEGGASGPAGTQLANVIEPFTPVAGGWAPEFARDRGAVVLSGSCAALAGRVRIEPRDDPTPFTGAFAVSYEFEVLEDVDPRQWGIVFTLPRSFERLRWDARDGAWPGAGLEDTGIGRPAGTACANPEARTTVEEVGVEPAGPWEQDANALGSNDFRSTKPDLRFASLGEASTGGPGRGIGWIRGEGDPEMAVRAWVDGDRVRLLVAGFNTGGADGFFATHYGAERRPLRKGDVIGARFRLHVD